MIMKNKTFIMLVVVIFVSVSQGCRLAIPAANQATQESPQPITTLAQATAQSQPYNTPRLRQLDFSPFAQDLAGFTTERAKKVEAIVAGADISTVQLAMQAGDLTSEDLTLFFLARIEEYDETLRTFVELNPNALNEARSADALRKAGKKIGPMLGIPVSVKDNIDTALPMHTTGGAEILLNHAPETDAPLVKQLREAGAVILGKANLSELAGIVTDEPPAGASAVGGVIKNPYGDFSPAGSSAGSAAGAAAYLTMVSVGTETAGSVIAPASFNGVVGLYPSKGLVHSRGVMPLVKNNDSAGPIGRNVWDIAILLGVIDTRDVDYAAGLDAKSLTNGTACLLKADILAQPVEGLENASDNPALIKRIERGFGAAGAIVKDVELTPSGIMSVVDQMVDTLFGPGIRYELLPYLTAAGAPVKTPEDLATYNRQNPQTRVPFGQASFEFTFQGTDTLSPDAYIAAQAEARKTTAASLAAAFADNHCDVLVSVSNIHSYFYPTANYPAINVPLGLRANGMPVGVTLIGKPGADAKLLSYAYAFEQATNLRVNPESFLLSITSK